MSSTPEVSPKTTASARHKSTTSSPKWALISNSMIFCQNTLKELTKLSELMPLNRHSSMKSTKKPRTWELAKEVLPDLVSGARKMCLPLLKICASLGLDSTATPSLSSHWQPTSCSDQPSWKNKSPKSNNGRTSKSLKNFLTLKSSWSKENSTKVPLKEIPITSWPTKSEDRSSTPLTKPRTKPTLNWENPSKNSKKWPKGLMKN